METFKAYPIKKGFYQLVEAYMYLRMHTKLAINMHSLIDVLPNLSGLD